MPSFLPSGSKGLKLGPLRLTMGAAPASQKHGETPGTDDITFSHKERKEEATRCHRFIDVHRLSLHLVTLGIRRPAGVFCGWALSWFSFSLSFERVSSDEIFDTQGLFINKPFYTSTAFTQALLLNKPCFYTKACLHKTCFYTNPVFTQTLSLHKHCFYTRPTFTQTLSLHKRCLYTSSVFTQALLLYKPCFYT